jgi:hypothetical protein
MTLRPNETNAQIVRTIAGRERSILVFHDAWTNSVCVVCDGEVIETKRTRRLFSVLWRYTFDIDGEMLELRVRTGLVDPSFELTSPTASIERMKFGFLTYLLVALIAGAMQIPFNKVPLDVRLGMALVAFLFMSALLLVYERRSSRA